MQQFVSTASSLQTRVQDATRSLEIKTTLWPEAEESRNRCRLLLPIYRASCSMVVSSEISDEKFPEIYSNLSGNLLITYSNRLFPVQHCKIGTFLTNNPPDLHALALCIMFRKMSRF